MMKISIAVLFCWTIILVSGQKDPQVVPSNIVIPPEGLNTTAASVTTTKLPTTHSSPATTSITDPTTVPANTTITPSSPVPPPSPTPAPAPTEGKWMVNGTNVTCIIISMKAQIKVTYLVDKQVKSKTMNLRDDNSTTVTGNCDPNQEQLITIEWPSSGPVEDALSFHFMKDSSNYFLHHIELNATLNDQPKSNWTETITFIHNFTEYKTQLNNSYRCEKHQRLNFTSNVVNITGFMDISDLQLQAFRNDSTSFFGYAENCTIETKDVVPIAVGCALIGLIVIVLVAYLIGRRRSQSRGYLSM